MFILQYARNAFFGHFFITEKFNPKCIEHNRVQIDSAHPKLDDEEWYQWDFGVVAEQKSEIT